MDQEGDRGESERWVNDCQAEGHVYELGVSRCIVCNLEGDWDLGSFQLTAWPLFVGAQQVLVDAGRRSLRFRLPDRLGGQTFWIFPKNWCWIPI